MSDRPKVNFRVPVSVKDAFEEAVINEFGVKRPYCGVELERELRTVLDMNDVAELWSVLDETLLALDADSGAENKTLTVPDEETAIVQYRINEEVRAAVKEATRETAESSGDFVARVMLSYALEGGANAKILAKANEVSDAASRVASADGPVDRRLESILSHLPDNTFQLDDFHEAVEKVDGISPGDHSVKVYLPKVLDRRDAVPTPAGVFVPREGRPDHPDPANLPYMAMSEEDKKLALKAAALRQANGSQRPIHLFTHSDAIDVLHGRPRTKTVRALLQDIASKHVGDGLQYVEGKSGLAIYKKRLDLYAHKEAALVAEVIDEDDLTNRFTGVSH